MRSIVKTVTHSVEYVILLLAGAVLRTMPVTWVYGIVRVLGFCAFHVFRVRLDVTLANLRSSLGGEMSERELRKIAGRAYVHIGTTFIEMLLVPKIVHHILDIVEMPDIEIAKRALRRGKGLILISGHFGSWETNGGALAAEGIPITVVAKSQSNPYADRLINRYRELFGFKVISTGAPLKHLIRALRNGEAIALISDQDAGKKGVFVDFFGRKASTPQGAAQLALKYNAPIVVVMTARTCPGRYKSIFREVDVHPDDTIESLTQRYTKVMEEIIRRFPDQYFWMHCRWKSSPSELSERNV